MWWKKAIFYAWQIIGLLFVMIIGIETTSLKWSGAGFHWMFICVQVTAIIGALAVYSGVSFLILKIFNIPLDDIKK